MFALFLVADFGKRKKFKAGASEKRSSLLYAFVLLRSVHGFIVQHGSMFAKVY